MLDQFFPADLTPEHQARLVVDSNGDPLRAFADADGVWRYETGPEQVSQKYLESLIQYEDRWFYNHPGSIPLSVESLLAVVDAWKNYFRRFDSDHAGCPYPL